MHESGALDTKLLAEEQAKDDDDDDDMATGTPGSSSSLTGVLINLTTNIVSGDDSSAIAVPIKEKELLEVEGKAEDAVIKEGYLTYFRAMGPEPFKSRPKPGFASGLLLPKMTSSNVMRHRLPSVFSPQP